TLLIITNNVFNTRELENINLTDVSRITSSKIWVRHPGRGSFLFTYEESMNKGVKDLDDIKKLLLIRFGYDLEKTPTDYIAVCHPKVNNLRASTPITELFNDDKSALEVTIAKDRNADIKKHETNINCAPPISGYGTQYSASPISGYGTQ
ncbi:534_t:CDS:2, partial [Gigaspora rosea]